MLTREDQHRFELPSTIMAALVLVLIAWIGLQHSMWPASQPTTGSASNFSAARAMVTVQRIARQPHPTGTTENAQVREYLLEQLRALGLKPQVQTTFAAMSSADGNSAGQVHNILFRIPGRERGKALLLMAHYDSVPNGYGAADDGASVAAILETVRVLQTVGPLRNDIVGLFTDGEEVGSLGATAFVAEHPWARDVGLALNFEYRGNRGAVVMFETSSGNRKLIQGFATARHPIGSSLMYEVYKLLPNSTDLTVLERAGIAGMNFAAIDGFASYHTQLDLPTTLSSATLQSQGELMMDMTRYFGGVDLTSVGAADCVYFDLPGLGVLSYPVSWVLPLSVGTALLFGIALWAGITGGTLRLSRVCAAVPVFVLITVTIAIGAALLWLAVRWMHPSYQKMVEVQEHQWYWLGFVFLTAGTYVAFQLRLQRWISATNLAMGAALVGLMALLASAIWMPGISFLLTWSVAPTLIAWAVLSSRRGQLLSDHMKRVVLSIGAAPGLLLFAPLIYDLFVALSTLAVATVLMVLTFWLGLVGPLLARTTQQLRLIPVTLVTGAVLILTGLLIANFGAQPPQADNLSYVFDAASGRAYWLSRDAELDEWERAYFGQKPVRRKLPELFGAYSGEYWLARAPDLGVQAPVIDVLEDKRQGEMRSLLIRVKTSQYVPQVLVYVDGATVVSSTLRGAALSSQPNQKWVLACYGLSDAGVDVGLYLKAVSAFKIFAVTRSYGLQGVVKPRNPGLIAQAERGSDMIQAVRSLTLVGR